MFQKSNNRGNKNNKCKKTEGSNYLRFQTICNYLPESKEQRIRAVLFYASVFIFFAVLPFILSFALGYKFNKKTFKFTKTGLVFVKTQPPGAIVYWDNRLLEENTPLTLRGIIPGIYHLKVELEKYYPWSAEIKVEPRKVTLVDKIILFPLRPNIKHINKGKFNYSWVDEEKSMIYYVNYEDNSIYNSDLEGGHYEKIGNFLGMDPLPVKWVVSFNRGKALYFNKRQVGIAYLEPYKEIPADPFILDYQGSLIIDVFWYSDNYHFVIISDKTIEILEANPSSKPVALVNLNKKNTTAFYNTHEEALYFIDSQKTEDGATYDNLYKLELNTRLFPFKELIKLNPNEEY